MPVNIEADLVHLPFTQHSRYPLWRLLGWHTWIPTLNSSAHEPGRTLWPASCLCITQSYWLCYFLGLLVRSWPLALSSPLSSFGWFCLMVRFTLDSPRCLCLCSPFYYNKNLNPPGAVTSSFFFLVSPVNLEEGETVFQTLSFAIVCFLGTQNHQMRNWPSFLGSYLEKVM